MENDMDYQGMVIRPPSEAFSIILQVTLGCSHNACTFCGTYRDKHFARKDWARIEQDIAFAARYCGRQHTLFLADGDVLALPHGELVRLLAHIKKELPWVRRVSCYASARNILAKTDGELTEYRKLGLKRLYLGLESGLDATLQAICKGAASGDMIAAARCAHGADMQLSVSCILGIAGVALSQEHAAATARVLNQMAPEHIGALTLMPLENTPLFRRMEEGKFVMPDLPGILAELRTLVSGLEISTMFAANHASNYLPITGRLPRNKSELLARIDAALAGVLPLRPEKSRSL